MKNLTNEIDDEKQNQLLKLVTNSFIKELKNYGVENKDIVKVSVNLLDYVTSAQEEQSSGNDSYNDIFKIRDIRNNFPANHMLSIKDVSLRPLDVDMLPKLAEWLAAPEIQQTLIRFFPKSITELEHYFFGRTPRKYFAVFYKQENYVGIIGADDINEAFKKLEMKKFIGDKNFIRKGIGKLATLLFLYYVFVKLRYNKVFIRSLDTNIKNINLNSKFGFELEGILYQEALIDNVFRDVLRMSLLRKRWMDTFG